VATVCEQKPLTTDTYSLPEPDITVVNRDFRDFELRHPKGEEAILVVELAWSTQDAKRRKASIYAAGGVEVYWLIDLAARKLELRTTPLDGGYQVTRILGEDDVVTLPESDVCWTVRELLPPSPARRP
jgi:Uma2 family endonuclease